MSNSKMVTAGAGSAAEVRPPPAKRHITLLAGGLCFLNGTALWAPLAAAALLVEKVPRAAVALVTVALLALLAARRPGARTVVGVLALAVGTLWVSVPDAAEWVMPGWLASGRGDAEQVATVRWWAPWALSALLCWRVERDGFRAAATAAGGAVLGLALATFARVAPVLIVGSAFALSRGTTAKRFMTCTSSFGTLGLRRSLPLMSPTITSTSGARIVIIKGQGIGPECIEAAQVVLAATGLHFVYIEGSLGYPDARDLLGLLQREAPEAYAAQFGTRASVDVADDLAAQAKEQARAAGNINDFYKKLLGKLEPLTLKAAKDIVTRLERKTLVDASKADAVLKGALRTLDEGDEPSRNVTIRRGFEQYANIRRCVTLDPIAPGMPGADILFVRENVEDLYASIEHRLARNYPQALRHQTPEGCELICRAAFEAAVRDGRKKVTALEKPNILKITGGLFKESFLKVARDYSRERLGDRAIEAHFMIIDDGMAAIAAVPERFDVVVTTNMFGDIGSDIAAKVTGGVGLVSSNNTNPNNPRAVSMFETMGGTADDIAGQNKANPVALIDAAAEMLLHIGGADNVRGAELIKTAVLEVLADGHYVGDIKQGPFQLRKGRERSGTREFTAEIVKKVMELRALKEAQPERTVKELALARADAEVQPLFKRILRSYERYAADMLPGSAPWEAFVERNTPPNPTRANSKILGFDMFVDDSGLRVSFNASGSVDAEATGLVPAVRELFEGETGLDLRALFNMAHAGSLQSIRSFGQYSARVMGDSLRARPELAEVPFGTALRAMNASAATMARFSDALKAKTLKPAVEALVAFDTVSIQLVQAFYRVRADEITPILREHGFNLLRITSRGTEIYPTMCDFEKRDVDRYRVEIDSVGPLAHEGFNYIRVQTAMMAAQSQMVARGWMISETMLNRSFIDGEGERAGQEMAGVSRPYAMNLGTDYRHGPPRAL